MSSGNVPGTTRRQSRAAFIQSGAGLLGAILTGKAAGAERLSKSNQAPRWKGKLNSRVKRWDIITIGNLSRNHYWGESDEKGLRPAICTCTLVQGEGFRLLVDPSLASPEEMTKELDRRTGLKPRDIDAVFVTHEHGDHFAGLANFPEAKWLAGAGVAAILNQSKKFSKPVEAAPARLFDAIDLVPTPGHTMGLCSLRFDCEGLSVVVAGDAVATRDFWRERRGYFNCVDFDLSARSMEKIAALADIVVPGHDNYFLQLDASSE